MIKTATDRRQTSITRAQEREERAGSSANASCRDAALQMKLNPDAVRTTRRERPGIDEDPERWDGLS
jgi:hypothetical protein